MFALKPLKVILILLAVIFGWVVAQPCIASTGNGVLKKDIRNAVYHVKVVAGKEPTLDDLRGAVVSITEHMESLNGPEKLNLYVVFHGPYVEFLQAKGIDQELQFMLQQLLGKGVTVGVCKICVEERGISSESLSPELVLITALE